MATTAKPKPVVRFETPTEVPDLHAAASLTIAMVKFLQSNTLDEVISKTAPENVKKQSRLFVTRLGQIDLSPHQEHLLNTYLPVLRLITVKPGSTLAVCPECVTEPTPEAPIPHGWQLVGSTKPSRCRMTAGCEGKPERATQAKKIELSPEDAAAAPASAPPAPEATLYDEPPVDPNDLVDFDDEPNFAPYNTIF